jgi:Raf kinase inhibitor-like YbhB/YbcL family protein
MDLQHVMRSLLRGVPRIALGGVPVERAGEVRLAYRKLGARPAGIRLESDFSDGTEIPAAHSADREATMPPVRWTGVPPDAQALALLVEDPDAPTPNPFVHLIVTAIPPHVTSLDAAFAAGAQAGRNSMLRAGWAACAPQKGDHAHRYVFQLFALDANLGLRAPAGRSALLATMRGHVIGVGLLTGTYRR